jgi:hypothetical protein
MRRRTCRGRVEAAVIYKQFPQQINRAQGAHHHEEEMGCCIVGWRAALHLCHRWPYRDRPELTEMPSGTHKEILL